VHPTGGRLNILRKSLGRRKAPSSVSWKSSSRSLNPADRFDGDELSKAIANPALICPEKRIRRWSRGHPLLKRRVWIFERLRSEVAPCREPELARSLLPLRLRWPSRRGYQDRGVRIREHDLSGARSNYQFERHLLVHRLAVNAKLAASGRQRPASWSRSRMNVPNVKWCSRAEISAPVGGAKEQWGYRPWSGFPSDRAIPLAFAVSTPASINAAPSGRDRR
jgi:hypothetical protein